MSTQASIKASEPGSEKEIIQGLVKKAHAAMALFANADQARVDEAVTALAWAIYEPVRAKELAELAVEDTVTVQDVGPVARAVVRVQAV